MPKRKLEYFANFNQLRTQHSVSHIPKHMCRQERDWTQSIACMRTIISPILPVLPSEDDILKAIKTKPGPKYSADIREWHYLETLPLKVMYGCEHVTVDFDDMLDLLKDDWFVMMQTMINYSHWMVLCGYYHINDNNLETNKVLVYDPYYDDIRLILVDEFIEMWIDGAFVESHVQHDFVAVHALPAEGEHTIPLAARL